MRRASSATRSSRLGRGRSRGSRASPNRIASLSFRKSSVPAGPGAAAYPVGAITMIVAYSPGGGTGLGAGALAPSLEKYLGGAPKSVIVTRAGAGGEAGFPALATAPADGYTMGFVNPPPLMT